MSPPAGNSGGDERRLSVRTLAIASIASATAAVVTSLFWARGTPIAAAVTPAIVTLVSEMLNRPTAKIAEKLTVERDALPDRVKRQLGRDAGGATDENAIRDLEAVRALRDEGPARRRPAAAQGRPAEASETPTSAGDVTVYGSGGARRRLPLKPIAVTAVLAFVIGTAILTVPELIAGRSIGNGDRTFSVLGGAKKPKSDAADDSPTETQTETTEQRDPRPQGEPSPSEQEPDAPQSRERAPTPVVPPSEDEQTQTTETTPTTPTPTTPAP